MSKFQPGCCPKATREDKMSDVIPTQNDIYPIEYPPQVPVEPARDETIEKPEEIDNRETDTGQNVDTFA